MDRFEAMALLREVVDQGSLSANGCSLRIPVPTLSRVGIDREATQMGAALDKYMRGVEDGIRQSSLTDPLKTQVLSNLDVVAYKGLSVVRIRVPKQAAPSFVGDDCFIRIGSSTHKAKGSQIAAVSAGFQNR